MTTSISYLHPWLTTPFSLISQVKKTPSITINLPFFCGYTEKKLGEQKISLLFFTLSKDSFYRACSSITIVAFLALGITACAATMFWFPPYLFATLTLSAVICYKFLPLFTTVFIERRLEVAYIKTAFQSVLKKEKKLFLLKEQELNDKLLSLGVSFTDFTKALCATSPLQTHPQSKEISRAILIHILARYEYLNKKIACSIHQLQKWEAMLHETRETLQADDAETNEANKLANHVRLSLEEKAEKIFAMIDEYYEFDIPSENQSSLLSDSIRAAYLLHLMKDPLNCPSPFGLGKTLAKQPFERAALGSIPSSQAFFLTRRNNYISKQFLMENLQQTSTIEHHLFS